MIRVILIDDHELFREGLRALLLREPDISVTAAASDAREGRRILDDHPGDLAIIDVSLPGSGGIALARDLKREEPGRRVLMLSMHDQLDVVAEALDGGVDGYALKSQAPAELLEAIHTVVGGGRYLAPQLQARSQDGNGHRLPPGLLRGLSRREREVFELLVRGDNNRQIATHLFISVKTVETHRTRIMKKLQVHSIAELVRVAVRHGHLAA